MSEWVLLLRIDQSNTFMVAVEMLIHGYTKGDVAKSIIKRKAGIAWGYANPI